MPQLARGTGRVQTQAGWLRGPCVGSVLGCFLAHSQTALSNRDRMPATHTIYNFIQSTVKKKKYKTVGKINFNNIFHLKYVNTTLI